jgi:S1-C subfamily serine protease
VSRGVLVAQVVDGGPSAAAGLRAGREEFRFQSRRVPRDADVITALAGRPVRDSDDLGTILNDYRPGQTIDLAIVRDKKPKTLRVKLTRRPLTASP